MVPDIPLLFKFFIGSVFKRDFTKLLTVCMIRALHILPSSQLFQLLP